MSEKGSSCVGILVRMLQRQSALNHAQWMVILTQSENDRMSVDTIIIHEESDSDDESVDYF